MSTKSAAVLLELEALGYIEFTEDREQMKLTEKGHELADKIMRKLPVDERLLVTLHCADEADRYFSKEPTVGDES